MFRRPYQCPVDGFVAVALRPVPGAVLAVGGGGADGGLKRAKSTSNATYVDQGRAKDEELGIFQRQLKKYNAMWLSYLIPQQKQQQQQQQQKQQHNSLLCTCHSASPLLCSAPMRFCWTPAKQDSDSLTTSGGQTSPRTEATTAADRKRARWRRKDMAKVCWDIDVSGDISNSFS